MPLIKHAAFQGVLAHQGKGKRNSLHLRCLLLREVDPYILRYGSESEVRQAIWLRISAWTWLAQQRTAGGPRLDRCSRWARKARDPIASVFQRSGREREGGGAKEMISCATRFLRNVCPLSQAHPESWPRSPSGNSGGRWKTRLLSSRMLSET